MRGGMSFTSKDINPPVWIDDWSQVERLQEDVTVFVGGGLYISLLWVAMV